MANKKAAQKYILQSRVRGQRNGECRSKLRTLNKKVRLAMTNNADNLKEIVSEYFSALDKAAKKNVIHKNAANRRKSIFAKCIMK